jgi:hypothetical protein
LPAFAVGRCGYAARINHDNIRTVINADDFVSVASELFSDGGCFRVIEFAAESM